MKQIEKGLGTEIKKQDFFSCNVFPSYCTSICDECEFVGFCCFCDNHFDEQWCSEHCIHWPEGMASYEN